MKLRFTGAVMLGLFCALNMGFAQTSKPTTDAFATKFSEMKTTWDDAMKKFNALPRSQKSMDTYPKFAPHSAAMKTLIAAHGDHKLVGDALIWTLENSQTPADADWVVDMALSKFPKAPAGLKALEALTQDPRSSATKWLDELITSKDAETSLRAQFVKASHLKSREEIQGMVKQADAGLMKRIIDVFGEKETKYLGEADFSKTDDQVKALLEAIVKNPASKKVMMGDQSIFAMADAKLNPPPMPVLGKVAPEISGKDVEGAEFKLSDYRGKVVMLDFWGTW